MTPPASRTTRTWGPAAPAALVVDALLIIAFAAIGRRTHDEAGALIGSLQTAGPFLAGMALGWLLVHLARRRAPITVRDGIPVWLCAVVGGLLLRALLGEGTALPFVIVATLVLGAFLLGWRLVARFARRRASAQSRR